MNLLVNIDVPELAPAVAFYTAAFGLQVGRRFGGSGVELVGATAPIYLLPKAAGTSPAPGPSGTRHYGRHWTPVHLDVAVQDIDEAVARAVAAGARLEQPVATHAWGKLALLGDPFGHGFCLVQFLGQGYDEIAQP